MSKGYYTPYGSKIAYPVEILNRGDFTHVRGTAGRFKGRTFSVVPGEVSTYLPSGKRVSGGDDRPEEVGKLERLRKLIGQGKGDPKRYLALVEDAARSVRPRSEGDIAWR